MGEFPVDNPPEVDLALSLVHTRFSKLNSDQLTTPLADMDAAAFSKFYQYLPMALHGYLFSGILSNAGQCRQDTDRENGIVYFGPGQKFRGYPPGDIHEGIVSACSSLKQNDLEPLYNITRFYQQFVLVHPFYDANGRIGRFITDTYLTLHGMFFSWKTLHQNTKWLKKINACHKRTKSNSYEEYLQRLVSYFEKCILKKDDIDPAE